jgi:hypothetical protein
MRIRKQGRKVAQPDELAGTGDDSVGESRRDAVSQGISDESRKDRSGGCQKQIGDEPIRLGILQAGWNGRRRKVLGQ